MIKAPASTTGAFLFLENNMSISLSAADDISASQLYRLYNTIAKRYFLEGEIPQADSRHLAIISSPLIVQKHIGEAFVPGIDANGMVTSLENQPIHLFINPFFVRYPRLLYITMAHEMVHVYCHWQFRHTRDTRWLSDGHGNRFNKMVATLIGRGLVGIKPSQDTVTLPHSYPVAMGRAKDGGYHFIRFDSYAEMTVKVMHDFAQHCDIGRPIVVGEMNSSIISIFPFIDKDTIVGEFFSYGPDPVFKMDKVRAYDWPKVE